MDMKAVAMVKAEVKKLEAVYQPIDGTVESSQLHFDADVDLNGKRLKNAAVPGATTDVARKDGA